MGALLLIARQACSHKPQPVHFSSLMTGLKSSRTIASPGKGHLALQTWQSCPSHAKHFFLSIRATPIATCSLATGARAPVVHALIQRRSSQRTQGSSRGIITGVPAIPFAVDFFMHFAGQAFTQSSHRVHNSRKVFSGIAPGGLRE